MKEMRGKILNHIIIKSPKEIEKMRKAGKLASDTLLMVGEHIRPGISTEFINKIVHNYIVAHGGIPAPLNYNGFPKSVCTSVNEVVCHGIPSKKEILKEGDIINVDITVIVDGYHGDTSATFYVGKPSPEAIKVVEVARRCLELGIEQVKPGARLGDIGFAIQRFAEACGCSVVRDYVGHGIGRRFHEPPQVKHFGEPGTGVKLVPGMTFTIEPMINLGDWQVEVLSDGWTVVTKDRKLSAQFEHTVLVTETGVEILTQRDRILKNSEDIVRDFF